MIQQLRRCPEPAYSEGAVKLSGCALDVLSVAIEQSAGIGIAQDRRIAGIKPYIISNLHDSSLSVEKIACALI
jgi:hypothetical protein